MKTDSTLISTVCMILLTLFFDFINSKLDNSKVSKACYRKQDFQIKI